MKNGVCLGKFMPLHLGHEHLINTGIANCDHLTIAVCTLSKEPIDGELRFQWMKNRYSQEILDGRVTVVHLKEDWMPQDPSECFSREVFYGTWAGTLKALAGHKIDVIFSSEDYGYPVAQYLECEHFLVDKARQIVPVSGTAIRNNPYENWQYMNKDVRKYFAKKILIIGPESTGKSTLTRNLANYYNRLGLIAKDVQEWAREWIDENLNGDMDKLEFDHITMFGKTQVKIVEDLYEAGDSQLIFSDTDAIVSGIFQDIYYEEIDAGLFECAQNEKWDLVLFTNVDVPWVDDGQRNLGNKRVEVLGKFVKILKMFDIEYTTVRGNWDERFEIATNAVDKVIGKVQSTQFTAL